MSEEEIIEENIKRYIKEHSTTIKAYTQKYVDDLQNQLQQKEKIIKEVREYIENNITANSNDDGDYWYEITEPIDEFIIDLKEILDKENK